MPIFCYIGCARHMTSAWRKPVDISINMKPPGFTEFIMFVFFENSGKQKQNQYYSAKHRKNIGIFIENLIKPIILSYVEEQNRIKTTKKHKKQIIKLTYSL